jgi:hypothetical protein
MTNLRKKLHSKYWVISAGKKEKVEEWRGFKGVGVIILKLGHRRPS